MFPMNYYPAYFEAVRLHEDTDVIGMVKSYRSAICSVLFCQFTAAWLSMVIIHDWWGAISTIFVVAVGLKAIGTRVSVVWMMFYGISCFMDGLLDALTIVDITFKRQINGDTNTPWTTIAVEMLCLGVKPALALCGSCFSLVVYVMHQENLESQGLYDDDTEDYISTREPSRFTSAFKPSVAHSEDEEDGVKEEPTVDTCPTHENTNYGTCDNASNSNTQPKALSKQMCKTPEDIKVAREKTNESEGLERGESEWVRTTLSAEPEQNFHTPEHYHTMSASPIFLEDSFHTPGSYFKADSSQREGIESHSTYCNHCCGGKCQDYYRHAPWCNGACGNECQKTIDTANENSAAVLMPL